MGKFDKINSILKAGEGTPANEIKEKGGNNIPAADIKNDNADKSVLTSEPVVTLTKDELSKVVQAKVDGAKQREKKKKDKGVLRSIKVEETHYKSLFGKFYEQNISMVQLNSFFYKKLDENKEYFKEIVAEVKKAKNKENENG